jgi:hypothetical protein
MRATLETLSTKTQEFVYLGGAVGIAICRSSATCTAPSTRRQAPMRATPMDGLAMTRRGKTDDMNMSRREDKTCQIIGAFVVRPNHRIARSDDAVICGGGPTLTTLRYETWRIIGAFAIVSALLGALIMTL